MMKTQMKPRLRALLSGAALALAAAAAPAQAQLVGQSVLTFSNEALSTLSLIGVQVTAAGTAGTITPGQAFSFPVTDGAITGGAVSSVITDPAAGVTLTRGSTVVTLFRFKVNVPGRSLVGDLNVNGSTSPNEPLYTLRSTSERPGTPPWRELQATGLYLTPSAVDKLGDALGVPPVLRPAVARIDFGRLDSRVRSAP